MTTTELKNILIHRISGINDKSFLSEISLMIEARSESTIFKTTAEQRKDIEEGRAEITNGEYFTNEQIELEIGQWLSEK